MPRALILAPQRRSMVSSNPITTGAPVGTNALTDKISSWRAAARDDHAARLRIRWKLQKLGSRSRPRMRSAVETVRRPGAKPVQASNDSTFDQVGRVNRSAKPTSRDRNRSSSIQEQTVGDNVGKLPWAAGTGNNLQGLCKRGQKPKDERA